MKFEDILNDAMKKGFDIFKKEYVTLIFGTVIAFLMMVFIITIPPMLFGIHYMCIQAVKGKKIQISDIFKGFDYFWRSWGIFLLGAIGVAVGLALLIIPGLILMVLWQFTVVIAILENKGVIDSLKRSYKMAREHFTLSIVFWILMSVISAVGSYTKIGTLLTFPFTAICTVIMTQKLAKKVKA